MVPPQSVVAGEGSSSAWAGCGATGEVADAAAVAAANTSKEATWADGGGADLAGGDG